jgi:hypothetical protein
MEKGGQVGANLVFALSTGRIQDRANTRYDEYTKGRIQDSPLHNLGMGQAQANIPFGLHLPESFSLRLKVFLLAVL